MNTTKKNLLIIAANGLGKTGVPNVIFQVCRSLCKYYQIDLIVFNDDGYYEQDIKNIGVNIIKIDIKEPISKWNRLVWRMFVEKKAYKKTFTRIFTSKEYFAIHSFKEYDSAYIFKLAEEFSIKYRIIHCNNEIKKPKHVFSKFFFRKKERIIRRFTTNLIGVSTTCCEKSYPGMKYIVLFNSYDENKYNFNCYNTLKDDELVLTQIATFSSRKNQLFTIDVFNEILKTEPNAKLNLVGVEVEEGYFDKIKDKIHLLGISESINIIDGTTNFYDIFFKTTFILLPSIHEAAPITLVEAQACGIFCFASSNITRDVDCGGIKYLAINEPTIWEREISIAFKAKANSRTMYNVNRFSSDNFNHNLLCFYQQLNHR